MCDIIDNNRYDIEPIISKIDSMVPIVGLEMIMHKIRDEKNRVIGEETLQSYIVDAFIRKRYLDFNNNTQLVERMKNEGYYGLSLLYNHFKFKSSSNPEERDDFDNYIEMVINEARKNKDVYLHQSIKFFLNTSKPSIILTTCPFNIIEEELNEGKRINYDSIYYLVDKDNNGEPILNEFSKAISLNEKNSFIVHLFGGTNEINERSPWVCTERKLMLFLHIFHKQRLGDSFKLATLLTGKKFLIMGCNLPEWLFQFMLYPLKRKNEADGSKWLKQIDNHKSTEEKKSYLSSINEHLSAYMCDAIDFDVLDDLTRELSRKQTKIEVNEVESYDFFISYRNGDHEVAEQVVNSLKKWGFNVWVDYEHKSDTAGGLSQNIQKAIEKSRHLVPIISTHYMERLSENETEKFGVMRLTNIASYFMFPDYDETLHIGQNRCREGAEKFIIPIINFKGKYDLSKVWPGWPKVNADLNDVSVILTCCNNNQIPIPVQFRELEFFYINREFKESEKFDIALHDFEDIPFWRELKDKGKTMKELGLDLLTLSERINNSSNNTDKK